MIIRPLQGKKSAKGIFCDLESDGPSLARTPQNCGNIRLASRLGSCKRNTNHWTLQCSSPRGTTHMAALPIATGNHADVGQGGPLAALFSRAP